MTLDSLPLAAPLLDDPAETFHRASRLTRLKDPSHSGPYTDRFFTEPGLHLGFGVPTLFDGDRPGLDLPPPSGATEPSSITGAMRRRRSRNVFAQEPLSRAALATILVEACAVTEEFGRSAPSPGRLYPLDCFVVVVDVDGIPSGLYGYHPFRNRLVVVGALDDPRGWLHEALAYRTIARTCSAIVFISAAFDRVRIKYGQRGYRFALLEAGHLAQSMLLLAAAGGVEACAVGGFFDDVVDRRLGLNGLDISVVHGVALGMPVEGDDDE